MPRLEWGAPEDRLYESGVSQVVLYVDGSPGIAWNGVVSIEETSEGGEARSFFYDGVKYKQSFSNSVFEAKIEAYTYPPEFSRCEGVRRVRPGFYVDNQRKVPFGLCYRTEIGDGVTSQRGYKLHLVYDAWVHDPEKSRQTLSDSSEPVLFTWNVTTVPVQLSGFAPSSHYVLDSRELPPQTMALIERYLYGSDNLPAMLPTPDELFGLLEPIPTGITLEVHDGGTFTVSGENDQVYMLDAERFVVDGTEVSVSDDTYTIST